MGAAVTDLMGRQAPEGLVGIHTNLLVAVLAIADQLPAESEEERAARDAEARFRADGFGYFLEMATRPQTIGYGLLDSPVAMAAWMLDHDTDSYYKFSRAFTGDEPTGNLTRETHRRQHHGVLADGHRRTRRRGRTGRTDEPRPRRLRPARLLRNSRSRSPSPRSRARSSRLRAAGSSRCTPLSPTSTRSRKAATSPPGRSPSCSRRSSGRRSLRFVDAIPRGPQDLGHR